MSTVHGPYVTREQAHDDARHVYQACALEHRIGVSDQICNALLNNTLQAAGVALGEYDQRIAAWLATWEPELVHAVIGWIERARAAEDAELREEINVLRAQIDALETKIRRDAPINLDFDKIRARMNGGAQ